MTCLARLNLSSLSDLCVYSSILSKIVRIENHITQVWISFVVHQNRSYHLRSLSYPFLIECMFDSMAMQHGSSHLGERNILELYLKMPRNKWKKQGRGSHFIFLWFT